MAMEQGVGVGKVLIAAGVDEDAARQREIAVNVGVDIGEVIFTLISIVCCNGQKGLP